MPWQLWIGSVAAVLGVFVPASAQVITEDYAQRAGSLRIGPEPQRQLPMAERGYTLVLPETRVPVALVVFLEGRRVDAPGYLEDANSFHRHAVERRIALLHLSTGNSLDFFFADSTMQDLAERLEALMDANGLRNVRRHCAAGLPRAGHRLVDREPSEKLLQHELARSSGAGEPVAPGWEQSSRAGDHASAARGVR